MVNDIERPLKIYCDNNSIIFYSNNNKRVIQSQRTSFILTNPLTKRIIPKVFQKHIAYMCVVP
ncbi:hypothetical protein CR513_32920, partial [Mucuna pruriens]